MLNSISWQQYLATLLVATGLYYLFIWIYFYGGVIPSFRKNENKASDRSIALQCMDELQPVFIGKRNPNELVLAIRQVLKKYRENTDPRFREAINEFITFQSETLCSIRLQESAWREVWS